MDTESYQVTAIRNQLSEISYQKSVIRCQKSATEQFAVLIIVKHDLIKKVKTTDNRLIADSSQLIAIP